MSRLHRLADIGAISDEGAANRAVEKQGLRQAAQKRFRVSPDLIASLPKRMA